MIGGTARNFDNRACRPFCCPGRFPLWDRSLNHDVVFGRLKHYCGSKAFLVALRWIRPRIDSHVGQWRANVCSRLIVDRDKAFYICQYEDNVKRTVAQWAKSI